MTKSPPLSLLWCTTETWEMLGYDVGTLEMLGYEVGMLGDDINYTCHVSKW